MVVATSGTSGEVNASYWDGTKWTGATLGDITSNAGDAKWILLKKDPDKDGFQLVVITSDSRLTTSYWDGGTWASTIDIDTSVDSNLASVADFAWNLTVLWVHWFGILILLG